MDTDIRFIMSSQQTENSVGLHEKKKKKVTPSFQPITERGNNEIFSELRRVCVQLCERVCVLLSVSCGVCANSQKKKKTRCVYVPAVGCEDCSIWR